MSQLNSDFIREFLEFQSEIKHGNKNITFFGSARLPITSQYCELAYKLAFKLNSAGCAVLTGGGDGIMAAANKGAFDSGKSPSVAFNIRLPFEQRTNPFATSGFLFSNFSPRKFALISSSVAFVIFPGGFGTLDELFEVLVLVQTGIQNAKIFLVGEKFWSGLDEFIKSTLIAENLVSKQDLNIYEITDDIDLIAEKILQI